MAWQGQVAGMQVTVVDTPGWYSESDCTQQQDREIVRGLTLSPQGFDAVLIVISLDFKFDQVSLDTLQDHIKLFGDSIWNHTMLLFTNQDTLGDRSLEEFIEGEDRPLRWLVDKCGNTYHCLHVTDQTDISQHYELFEKIEGMSAKNQGRLFRPDMKDVDLRLHEKFQRRIIKKALLHKIEQAVRRRELELFQDHKNNLEKLEQDIKEMTSSTLTLSSKSRTKKKSVLSDIENQIQGLNANIMKSMGQLRSSMDFGVPSSPPKKLKELRILILGEKLSGKTTAANFLLRGKVFPAQPNDGCMAKAGPGGGVQVTVVDTPGWYSESDCTQQQDREIVRGLTLSPQGFDAVLIVISLDFKFDQVSLDTLQDHIKLFGDSIWNHTMLLFTNQDTLGDRSLEEFIEGEDRPLRWLVDKCGNTYHCLHVTDQTDISQHYELFEKIEGMSAKNQGRLFRPNMKDVDLRLHEKFQRRIIKKALEHKIEQAVRRRELELCQDLKKNLEKLQQDIKEIFSSPLALPTGSKSRTKKKSVLSDIENQIQGLNANIMKSMGQLRSSMDFGVPSMSGSTQYMDEFQQWLSHLHVRTNQDSTLTLNYSESSGYESHFSDD
ncbi:immune-associated nucleotide-binding protein 12-like [Hippocampus comes]|uniref:immune-associated nucleotide-binding protein 12-like n=1 Tax=Hippocampus comes TaxID=109280 RepID=UPI00094DFFA4|nr:PREDICTED: immune-associated nucleotide-binding protein 12-like [Hippocampus comes]